MSSMDSKADFTAMMTELQVPDKAQEWLLAQGFSTISDLAFTFVNSADGAALLSKLPEQLWTDMGVDLATEEYSTTVPAGKLRRLLAQCRMMVQQFSTSTTAAWQELAPPRLTPEAVNQMIETFQTNFPGELLTSETTPSIRLLSVVHHYMKPGQAIQIHSLADSNVSEAVSRHDGGQDS